ncbi:MAG: DNA translocase FtsK 4TM domain-containing protein, partial [Caulobacterales bacterium]
MARTARKTGMALVWHIAGLAWTHPATARLRGGLLAAAGAGLAVAFVTYNAADPSLNAASDAAPTNALGAPGAALADLGVQSLGLASALAVLTLVVLGLCRAAAPDPRASRLHLRLRGLSGAAGVLALAAALAWPAPPVTWPLAKGLGGFWGDALLNALTGLLRYAHLPLAQAIAALLFGAAGLFAMGYAIGLRPAELRGLGEWLARALTPKARPVVRAERPTRAAPRVRRAEGIPDAALDPAPVLAAAEPGEGPRVKPPKAMPKESPREQREAQSTFEFARPGGFALPELSMLAKPKPRAAQFDEGALRQNAQLLESVLAEFGVRGQVDQIRPGPVVTLYELVPAAGVKSARVVALSDDIARSMSVAACRVSVVPGRNAIGIELPNQKRETVYLRDLLASSEYERGGQSLPMALGETIGGEPYIADLARMPHLLIAGTTGSGKSVGVNAMILSILYRLPPSKCRFIMV